MITIKAFSRDINGNSTVKVSGRIPGQTKDYSFSIQTQGNLPFTHFVKLSGVKPQDCTKEHYNRIVNEITLYLMRHGTTKQKMLINIEQDYKKAVHFLPSSKDGNVRCLNGSLNLTKTYDITLVTCPLCLDSNTHLSFWQNKTN